VRPLARRARRARARRSDSPSGGESRCRARRVHRPRAGSPPHTRARDARDVDAREKWLETMSRAVLRRCARGAWSAALEKSAERTVRDRGETTAGSGARWGNGTRARGRRVFGRERGMETWRGMRGIESRCAMRWARVG